MRHTEAELHRLIEDNGSSWNAGTSKSDTEYQIDIFDKNLPLAIDALYEIITDTTIISAKLEQAREIIYVVNKTLRRGRQVTIRSVPTLTYTQLHALSCFITTGVAMVPLYAY